MACSQLKVLLIIKNWKSVREDKHSTDTGRKRETGHYLETPTITKSGCASNLSMEELEKFKDGLIMRQTEDGEITFISTSTDQG